MPTFRLTNKKSRTNLSAKACKRCGVVETDMQNVGISVGSMFGGGGGPLYQLNTSFNQQLE